MTLTYEQFLTHYKITEPIIGFIERISGLLEKLARKSEPTIKDPNTGITYKIQNILIETNTAIKNYITFKQKYFTFLKWYYSKPFSLTLNHAIAENLIYNANKIRQFETDMTVFSDTLIAKLDQADGDPNAVSVGAVVLLITLASIGVVGILFTYFWKNPNLAQWGIKSKVLNYDLETMEKVMQMQNAGTPPEQIISFQQLRNKGIDRSSAIDTDAYAMNNFISGTSSALQTVASVKNILPIILIGGAVMFFMKKRK